MKIQELEEALKVRTCRIHNLKVILSKQTLEIRQLRNENELLRNANRNLVKSAKKEMGQ